MGRLSAFRSHLLIWLLVATVIITILAEINIQTGLEVKDRFEECTAVIVTGTAAKDGRAILMKNRDTSDATNKPVYHPPTTNTYAYTMVNTYWMGINEKGLAVMNTLVSALRFGGSSMDNGALNRWIVEHCETVEEVCFELNNTNGPIGPGKRLGGTCVGVIDRFGNGAFIEISGVGAYARFIVDGYDSQANHPRYYPGYASGPSGRDQYALTIMNQIYAEKKVISWEDVAQNVSRYVRNKEQGSSSFSISGEISNTATQAAMVAVSGDQRYGGRLNCMWGEYGNPPMVGLFVPSITYAGEPPSILNGFWDHVWEKRSYAQDASGYYYEPPNVREIQSYTFFAEDYTFWKYDELIITIPNGLSDSELRTRLQEYVDDTVQVATQIYIAEPQVSVHTIAYEETEFQIRTVSNSTISEFEFSATPNIKISFNLIGTPDTSGFCYITIPIELSDGWFQITTEEEQYTIPEPLHNAHENILNFTYTHPNHATITTSVTEHDLSNFDLLFTTNNVKMIYPSENTSKPLGCEPAMVSDWTASAFISTKLQNFEEGTDTDSNFVNQTTGKPLGDQGVGIITFGGPLVNPVVKYAQEDDTPIADKAPIKFHNSGDIFYFQHSNGTNIPGANLPASVINQDKDMFVIEIYEDAEGRYILLCYGFGWKGTYAAGKYFHTKIYPNLESYDVGWIIIKWEDTNSDGFVNAPEEGDTYTIIASNH